MVGGVAVAAAARTFPFRVFSFPSQVTGFHFDKIVADDLIVPDNSYLTVEMIRKAVKLLRGAEIRPFDGENFRFDIHPTRYKELQDLGILDYPLSV